MGLTAFVLAAGLMLTACHSTPQKGYDALTEANHPRLFASDSEFAKLRRQIKSGKNEVLCSLNAEVMKIADTRGQDTTKLVYRKDESGKRILSVSRDALSRIFCAAYAYRLTGDEKYLKHAEWDINTVCDFKNWNPRHYLDVAEMTAAVSIGYDWLYPVLQDSTKAKVLMTLDSHAFKTSQVKKYTNWYDRDNNWNQVCNAGLVCAALATYESNPEEARRLIDKAVETNSRAMEAIYAPIGAYYEGPVYWTYGNMFETMMLYALDSTLGTDFGLGDTQGFNMTGDFEIALQGNNGKFFNYSDNCPSIFPIYSLWYFADRYKRPDLVYLEAKNIGKPYTVSSHEYEYRLSPLAVLHASHIKPETIRPSAQASFVNKEKVPLAIFRTGWDENDIYLGIKGGRADAPHGHADVGEFVYECGGVRWACDLARQEYADLELPCVKMGSNLWHMNQESVRWKIFRYRNLSHNTITVNGKCHDVSGFAPMTAVYDNESRCGAGLDLKNLYWGALTKAVREVSIRESSYLEVVDSLSAAEDASIRWTLVGEGEPELCPDGIILKANGMRMLLKMEVLGSDSAASSLAGRIYSSDPTEDGCETAWFEQPVKDHLCGFELKLPAGQSCVLTTTLKELR